MDLRLLDRAGLVFLAIIGVQFYCFSIEASITFNKGGHQSYETKVMSGEGLKGFKLEL